MCKPLFNICPAAVLCFSLAMFCAAIQMLYALNYGLALDAIDGFRGVRVVDCVNQMCAEQIPHPQYKCSPYDFDVITSECSAKQCTRNSDGRVRAPSNFAATTGSFCMLYRTSHALRNASCAFAIFSRCSYLLIRQLTFSQWLSRSPKGSTPAWTRPQPADNSCWGNSANAGLTPSKGTMRKRKCT